MQAFLVVDYKDGSKRTLLYCLGSVVLTPFSDRIFKHVAVNTFFRHFPLVFISMCSYLIHLSIGW